MSPAPSARNPKVLLPLLLVLLLALAACGEIRGDLSPVPPMPVNRPPADSDQGFQAEVAVPRLNLRARPTTRAAILAVLGRGTLVRVGSSANGWLRVSTCEGLNGWVYGSYVRLLTPAPDAAAVSATPEPARTPLLEANPPPHTEDATQLLAGPTPTSAAEPPGAPPKAGDAGTTGALPAAREDWVTFEHPAAHYRVAHPVVWQPLYRSTDHGDELVLASPSGASELRIITAQRPGYRPAEFYADLVAPLSEAHGIQAEISLPTRSSQNGRTWLNGQALVYTSPATRHAIGVTEGPCGLVATVTRIRPWITEPEIDLLQIMRTGLVLPPAVAGRDGADAQMER